MLIILRSTTACNLNCTYCSSLYTNVNNKEISENDCRLLIKHLPYVLSEGEQVTYLWHGGEPTTLSPDKFSKMQEILNGIEKNGHKTRCLMQSNGYNISSQWINVLRQFNVSIGISIDGPQDINDSSRITFNGAGTYNKVLENIKYIKENNIKISTLCTVQEKHLKRTAEILLWIKNNDTAIRFNPLLHLGRSKHSLSMENYYNFLRKIFIEAINNDFIHSIQPLEWMIRSVIFDEKPTECSYSGNCESSIFSYSHNGDIYQCNRSNVILGNLNTMPLYEILASKKLKTLKNNLNNTNACCKCKIFKYCNGGCKEIHYENKRNHFCLPRIKFFTWLTTEGIDILHKYLINQRSIIKEQINTIRKIKNIL